MKAGRAKPKKARGKPATPGVRSTELSHKPGPRRAEILAIARKLFAEKGFQATSIREIANAAGILSGSLYYHFDTKEDMLHEIIRDYASYLRAGYEECAAPAANPREAIIKMLHFGITESIQRREVYSIITIERNFMPRQSDHFRYLEETWQDLYRIWYDVLQGGVRTGYFRKDINLHLALRIMMDAINSTIRWYQPSGRYPIEEVIETQTSLLLNGLNKVKDSK